MSFSTLQTINIKYVNDLYVAVFVNVVVSEWLDAADLLVYDVCELRVAVTSCQGWAAGSYREVHIRD
jgi:hypothetical protein